MTPIEQLTKWKHALSTCSIFGEVPQVVLDAFDEKVENLKQSDKENTGLSPEVPVRQFLKGTWKTEISNKEKFEKDKEEIRPVYHQHSVNRDYTEVLSPQVHKIFYNQRNKILQKICELCESISGLTFGIVGSIEIYEELSKSYNIQYRCGEIIFENNSSILILNEAQNPNNYSCINLDGLLYFEPSKFIQELRTRVRSLNSVVALAAKFGFKLPFVFEIDSTYKIYDNNRNLIKILSV